MSSDISDDIIIIIWNNKKRGKNNKSPHTTFGRLNNLEILCWDANTKVAQTPCLPMGLQLSVIQNVHSMIYT